MLPTKSLNFATTIGLLTATGAETVMDTTAVINYCINGKGYQKAASADITTPTTDGVDSAAFTALAANQGCMFTIGLDASGNWKAMQGPIETLDASGNFDEVAPDYPPIPDGVALIGSILVKNGSTGSAWTFGSDNWNATGITLVVDDLISMPDRPQVS